VPDYGSAYYNRGIAHIELGRYQQAIEDYNEAIKLKADDMEAYYNRGLAYLQQGNFAQGCRDAQKACEPGKCDLLEIAKSNGFCR
jgi:tetratricopeptide (TPR) repeat protein